jgi:two-component system, HptB-dependent secretion and biofilm response regulator
VNSNASVIAPTILVVDDTPENIDMLRGLLHEQYVIRAAINGQTALRLALMEPIPELILLDVMMPGMDGYEVCRQLKANPHTQGIPIIFCTAMAETVNELHGLALGAVDYLTKPVIPEIVKARVSTHLALRKAQRELEEKNLILSDEKELLEDIITRTRSHSPFDGRKVRHIQKSLERACGDIVLSAYRPNGTQHVLVGDFSGHGLTAAFAGPLVSYIFYSLTADGHDLHHILAEVNRILCRQLPTQLYMAASALELSPERNQVRVWNYGVPPVLCLSDAHDMITVKSSGLPLGLCESFDDIEPHAQLEACPGMSIYQYSDGITEANSPSQEAFGQKNLEELVMRIFHEKLPLEVIWEELKLHCEGLGLSDDAVMVETTMG